jgi:hypothetical protein
MHEQQHYIYPIADKLGIEVTLHQHSIETTTCKEKAKLIGFPVDRVIKALYVSRKKRTIGIITPEFEERVPIRKILRQVGVHKPREYRLQRCPTGMIPGTCTPFPYEDIVGDEIHELLVISYHPIDDLDVDISIGGGVEGKLKSLHLPYKGIYAILHNRFKERVHLL